MQSLKSLSTSINARTIKCKPKRSYDGDSDSPWRVVFTHMYGSYFGLT